MLLKDVFDYSLEEIAALVDSTVGGVKAALNRGRIKLAAGAGTGAARAGTRRPDVESPARLCTSSASTRRTGTVCAS